jgi:hypothetical protein
MGRWRGDRQAALIALVAGLAVVALAQATAPRTSPPLYDGVIVQETYRWLQPPSCQPGGPTALQTLQPVAQGTSPGFAASTDEQPPQAQLLVAPNSLPLPEGTTGLQLEVTAVDPPPLPSGQEIAGNAYRISMATQSGAAVTIPASAGVTVILRGPMGIPTPVIGLYADGAWHELTTDPTGGVPHTYQAVITGLGTFALLVPAGTTIPCPGVLGSPLDLASLIRIVVFAVIFVPFPILFVLWIRSRRRRREAGGGSRRSRGG